MQKTLILGMNNSFRMWLFPGRVRGTGGETYGEFWRGVVGASPLACSCSFISLLGSLQQAARVSLVHKNRHMHVGMSKPPTEGGTGAPNGVLMICPILITDGTVPVGIRIRHASGLSPLARDIRETPGISHVRSQHGRRSIISGMSVLASV